MFSNYLTSAFRNLRKHKGHSLINIVGLAAGLAVCLLIWLWVEHELSFDGFHQNGDRINRVMSVGKYFGEGYDGSPAVLAPSIENVIPGIAATTRILAVPRVLFRVGDTAFYEGRGMMAEQSLFDIFSFPFVAGGRNTALAAPDDVVLTESLARKYFGDGNPIGRTIESDEGRQLTVSAVLADLPANSTFCFDFIAYLPLADTTLDAMQRYWGIFMTQTFVLLEPAADPAAIATSLTEIAKAAGCPQVNDGVRFELSPLSQWHLDEKNASREYATVGSSTMVLGFSAIAVFVLLVACINFVNLTTARAAFRAREVGMRKTVGASRGQLIRQFLGESILTAAAAFVVALFLVELTLPYVRELTGRQLAVPYMSAGFVTECVAVVVLVGVLAGLYPAFHLARFQPVQVLKSGGAGKRGRVSLRRVLVVVQFSLSIALLVCTGAVYRQLDFVRHKNLGFDRENVIHIPIKGTLGEQLDAVKVALRESPHVQSVSAQYNLEANVDFWSNGFGRPGVDDDYQIQFNTSYVGYDYFRTMGMTLVEGRAFSRERPTDAEHAFVLNQEAVRVLGFTGSPIDSTIRAYGSEGLRSEGTVIGVIGNAYLRSLHDALSPRIYQLIDDFSGATDHGVVLIRIDGRDVPGTVAHIRDTWEQFNGGTPFEYRFLDDTYAGLYERDNRISRVLSVFTALTIFVSCLGLLGLASFSVQTRTREIGVRKVLGATVTGLVRLVAAESAVLVLAANVIGIPVAYYAASRLLEYYAYRIDINLWLFAVPAASVLATALVTVSYQAARAALTNPVEALRHE